MASGKFTSQNKIRPGAYFNFVSGKKQTGVNATGIMAMTLPLDWGTPNTFLEITNQTNLLYVIGRSIEEPQMVLLREALKSAQKVLLFNVAGVGSSKASGTINADLTIEAIKFGAVGNEIKVVIDEDMDNSFVIYTYFKNTLMDKQTVTDVTGFSANEYIKIAGTGTIEPSAGITLTGGKTENSTTENYTEFLTALELQDFYTFTIDAQDEVIKQTAVKYCKKWRDQEGKKVIFITADMASDYEGVVNIGNGVILHDGQKLSAAECAPYIAGAMASSGITRSLTYHVYEGAMDANPRLNQADVEEALTGGKFVFTRTQENVVVEQDINSLKTFTDAKNRDFRKNKIVRIIDTLNIELLKLYATSFIGQVSNDVDGRELLKKDILALLEEFKQNSALNDYESEDVEVISGQDKDVVIVNMNIKIADAMEKMYVTVTLN